MQVILAAVRPKLPAKAVPAKSDVDAMHTIEMHQPSEAFLECWSAAGRHLQARGEGAVNWLKADPRPPFLEHLSFRLGNQLFFVRIADVDDKLLVPANPKGFLTIADGCKGHGCLMPMRFVGGAWHAVAPGWGLIDGRTGAPVDPPSLVTDELVEITDWELHDFAVQVIRNHLEEQGATIASCTGDPNIDPAMWILREGRREWIVVRAVRYPTEPGAYPRNWDAISEYCRKVSPFGYFAAVGVANHDEESNSSDNPLRLWRGHGYAIAFEGLVPSQPA